MVSQKKIGRAFDSLSKDQQTERNKAIIKTCSRIHLDTFLL